jgi:hypothetical protein
MLDPRIYRTGLMIAALALVVLGFSLRDQAPALTPSISPAAFNGQEAATSLSALASTSPERSPGSPGDRRIAAQVAAGLRAEGFAPVSTDRFPGETVYGTRTLENVVGIRPGIQSGSIVIVAGRDVGSGSDPAALAGTATLLELARDLAGETLHRSVVLASVSGSQGGAGAIRLASSLAGPIDAVIALGNLTSPRSHGPIVVPWAANQLVAPPQLRNTLAATLAAQTPFTAQSPGLGGQFVRLAFPLDLGDQAPFGAAGVPAVGLSLSGPDEMPPGGVVDETTLAGIGRAVLATVSALDAGPTVAAPSSYLVLSTKMIPGWAVSLFVLGLLIPVVMTTLDGLARARRRGHVIWRSVVLLLGAGVPFIVFGLVVLVARVVGAIAVAPPGPVAPGAIPFGATDIAVLAVALLAMVATGVTVARLAALLPAHRPRGRAEAQPWQGAIAALPAVLCTVCILIWLANPYAALLVIPALHLWLWITSPELRLPRVPRVLVSLVGILPPLVALALYAASLGYGPLQAVWQGVLLIAGHAVAPVSLLEWGLVLGCLAGALTLSWLAGQSPRDVPSPVTVRGPATYAGPGSLGGTKSALRR